MSALSPQELAVERNRYLAKRKAEFAAASARVAERVKREEQAASPTQPGWPMNEAMRSVLIRQCASCDKEFGQHRRGGRPRSYCPKCGKRAS